MIKTDTFTLRPWRISDAETLTKHANNINIWNNVRDFFPHPYTLEDAYFYINMVKKEEKPLNFAIVIDGEAVGGIGLIPGQDVERLNAEIGYWLGEDFWGKGLMTSVVSHIVDYAFNESGFMRLHAPVFEHNPASMRVLEKAGFQKYGVMHKGAIKNDKIIDLHCFEIICPTLA